MPNGFIPYRIVSQQNVSELTPDGRFVDVWEIRFETPSGVSGLVRIPTQQYAPEVVDVAIEDEVQRIEAVQQLGASPLAPPPGG